MMLHKIGAVTPEELTDVLTPGRTKADVEQLCALFDRWVDYREGTLPITHLDHLDEDDEDDEDDENEDVRIVRRYGRAVIGADEWMLVYDEGNAAVALDMIQDYSAVSNKARLRWQRNVLAYLLPRRHYALVRYSNTRYAPINTMVRHGGIAQEFDHELYTLLIAAESGNDGAARIARMLLAGSWRQTSTNSSYVQWTPYGATRVDWNYFKVVPSGAISYLPKASSLTGALSPWERSGRVQQRAGRFVRAYFTPEQLAENGIGDVEIEQFAQLMKTRAAQPLEHVHLVSGDDIAYWYDGNTYHHDAGELNSSCMRYDECQRYFGIYTDNPSQVQMLCVFDGPPDGAEEEPALLARGIVWTDDDGERWLDRVYASYAMIPRVYAHAEAMGIRNLRQEGKDVTVTLEHPWHTSYPYMDTMEYLHEDGTLRTDPDARVLYVHLVSTGGEPNLSPTRIRCPACHQVSFSRRTSGQRCQTCRGREMDLLVARMHNPRARITTIPGDIADLMSVQGHARRCMIDGTSYLVIAHSGMVFAWDSNAQQWRRRSKRQFAIVQGHERRRLRQLERQRAIMQQRKRALQDQIALGTFPGNFDIVDTLPAGSWHWRDDTIVLQMAGSPYEVICTVQKAPDRSPWGYELVHVETRVQDASGWRVTYRHTNEERIAG